MTSCRNLLVALAVCAIAIPSIACSRETPAVEGAFANDLKAVGGPLVGKGGIADDGIKPVVKPAVVGKGGVIDDSVKPLIKPGVVTKTSTNDDGIKPVVKPGVVTKTGTNDDGIKPVVSPAPAPAPTPR